MQLDVVLTVRADHHQVAVVVEVHRVKVFVAFQRVVVRTAEQAVLIRESREFVIAPVAMDHDLREHIVVGQHVVAFATVDFDAFRRRQGASRLRQRAANRLSVDIHATIVAPQFDLVISVRALHDQYAIAPHIQRVDVCVTVQDVVIRAAKQSILVMDSN